MPELPEVETVRQGLLPAMSGKQIKDIKLRRKNLRFDFDKDLKTRLIGKMLDTIERRSKYLLFHFSDRQDGICVNNETLIGHLGMSGKFTIYSDNEAKMHDPLKHDHVVFYMSDGTEVIYNDPRRFGFLLLAHAGNWQSHKLMANIGPEPLSDGFDAHYLADISANKKTNIKSHLLNQKIVAGLGNIYVCEALFKAGINPTLPAAYLALENSKPSKACKKLVPIIKDILNDAILAGGSSLKDYRNVKGSLGYFQHQFKVYGREGAQCYNDNCEDIIARISQAGRSTFYCPSCQNA